MSGSAPSCVLIQPRTSPCGFFPFALKVPAKTRSSWNVVYSDSLHNPALSVTGWSHSLGPATRAPLSLLLPHKAVPERLLRHKVH